MEARRVSLSMPTSRSTATDRADHEQAHRGNPPEHHLVEGKRGAVVIVWPVSLAVRLHSRTDRIAYGDRHQGSRPRTGRPAARRGTILPLERRGPIRQTTPLGHVTLYRVYGRNFLRGAVMLPHPGRAAAGVLCILVSATCYGAMPIFAEFAYRHGADVRAVLLIRSRSPGLCSPS